MGAPAGVVVHTVPYSVRDDVSESATLGRAGSGLIFGRFAVIMALRQVPVDVPNLTGLGHTLSSDCYLITLLRWDWHGGYCLDEAPSTPETAIVGSEGASLSWGKVQVDVPEDNLAEGAAIGPRSGQSMERVPPPGQLEAEANRVWATVDHMSLLALVGELPTHYVFLLPVRR